MRWKVEISGFSGDLRLLQDVLEPLSLGVSEADHKIYIAGDRFERLVSAVEVHGDAVELRANLAALAANAPEIQLQFEVGGVVEMDNGILKRTHIVIAVASAGGISTVSGAAAIISSLSEAERKALEDKQREHQYQESRPRATAWMISASRSAGARKVQRFLNGALTPLTMGHIVDLIQAEEPGAILKLGISDKQLGRLTGSINHPDIFGEEARHIVASQVPPPKPMELDEARAFVRDLAARWFARIAGI